MHILLYIGNLVLTVGIVWAIMAVHLAVPTALGILLRMLLSREWRQ